MVLYCAVTGCNRNSSRDKNYSFFTIPKSGERRAEWLAFLGKTDSDNFSPGTRVCQDHFEQSCFIKKYQRPIVYQKCEAETEKDVRIPVTINPDEVKEIPGYVPVGKYDGELRTRLLFTAVPSLHLESGEKFRKRKLSNAPQKINTPCNSSETSTPKEKKLKTEYKIEESESTSTSSHIDPEDSDESVFNGVESKENVLDEIEVVDIYEDDEEDPPEGQQDPLSVPETKKLMQKNKLQAAEKKIVGKLPSTALKLEDLCRLCLKPSKKFQQISEKVRDMIMTCTPIKMDDPKDRYPNYICVACWQTVTISFEFWNDCNRVNGYVRQIINSNQVLSNVYIDANQLLIHDKKITEKLTKPTQPPKQGLKRPEPRKDPKKFQYKCKTCDEVYTDFNLYKTHTMSHELAKEKEVEYKCTLCDKLFENSKEYQTHATSHELVKMESIQQNDGGQSDSDSENVDVQLRLFKCDYCSRQYFSIVELKAHLRIHYDERVVFDCKGCQKQFSSIATLKYHEVLSHGLF